ncbi:hypothetical protein H0H93_016869 [Arthromyces matolae]|nr:hypothetical protein H0H93_016869 [Arthromyces matolae]
MSEAINRAIELLPETLLPSTFCWRLPLPHPLFAAAWIGGAGLDRPADLKAAHARISKLLTLADPTTLLVTDDAALLSSAIIKRKNTKETETCVVLIAGTGSLAKSFIITSAEHKLISTAVGRAGGWGYLLGDEGSAYGIGREAIRRTLRHRDAGHAPTSFHKQVAAHFGCTSIGGIISAVYAPDQLREDPRTKSLDKDSKLRVASLCPVVFGAAFAVEPDEEAVQIVTEGTKGAVETLMDLLNASDGVTSDASTLVLGGALGQVKEFRELLVKELARRGEVFASVEAVSDAAGSAIGLLRHISTTYVDHLHSRPSAPPSPSITPSPSRPKTPTQNTNTNLIVVPIKHSSEPPSRAPTPCPAQNCSSYVSTETTPLLAEPRPKRAKSLCNLDDDSMLSLILLNAPRLARGGLPHSGLSGWNREPACVCHMRVMHAQAHEIGEAFVEEEDVKDDQPGTIGRKRQIVGILLGIMIHSFVIGLTLAITSGTDFTSLVTAITFHQLFEGLSLGIRIAGVPPSTGPGRRWLAPVLYAFFAITTPLGMGVGLLLFASTQTGDSVQLHLAQGLMSGISAGMLIYASTVEMLAGDFVFGDVGGDHGHGHGHGHGHEHEHPHQHEHEKSPVRRKILAVLSLLAGATAMALVGLTED